MVVYRQLLDADPDALNGTSPSWRRLGEATRRCADGVEAQQRALLDDWSGAAARLAQRRLSALRESLLAAGPILAGAAAVLEDLADGLREAQRGLVDATLRADGDPVLVEEDGSVRLDWHGRAPDPYGVALGADVRSRIGVALRQAALLDTRAAAALRELADAAADATAPPGAVPDPARGAMAVPLLASRPAPGSGAAAVFAWWRGLGGGERRWLTAHEPRWLGGLDGVPARVRDEANRIVLAREWESLLARRGRALAGAPAGGWSVELARVDGLLAGLAAIGTRLDRSDAPRALLLGLDTCGRGHAIVAFGDPDGSRHVVTYVPGVGSRLAIAGGLLDEAERLHQAATGATRAAGHAQPPGTGDARCAVIAWLGYDAPARITDATVDRPARDAAPVLRRFLDGLRAVHQGPAAHLTLVGHSYGSTVAGWAAREAGPGIDDLVLLGSPGAGASRASELAGATRVWASTAVHDPIATAYSLGGIVGQVAGGPLRLAGEPDGELVLGRDPTSPGFGARVFASAPGSSLHPLRAHLSYLAPGAPALRAVAEIAVGRGPGR